MARVYMSDNHEVEAAFLTIICSKLLSGYLFPVTEIFSFGGMELSVLKEGIL